MGNCLSNTPVASDVRSAPQETPRGAGAPTQEAGCNTSAEPGAADDDDKATQDSAVELKAGARGCKEEEKAVPAVGGTPPPLMAEASDSMPQWKSPKDDSPFYVLRKTVDVTDKYYIAEELGRGQFGVVSVAVEKVTSKRYAIKSMSKRKAEADPNFRKDIRNEVEIMYHLGGHPNIVALHEVYEDAEAIHLILELCEGGDWFERLLAHGTYSERQAAATARTVLETLAYCHSLGVVHRDLKPENLLLTDRSGNAMIKLADFGLSALAPETALQAPESNAVSSAKGLLHDAVGSAYYVAPEVLMAHVYGKEVDIWSMGVVIFIALGGYPPFDGANEQQILRAVVYNPLRFDDPSWDGISASAKDLISRMLCKDPRRRATVPELLEHPWLNPARKSKGGESKPSDSGRLEAAKPASKSTRVPDTVVTRLHQFAALNRFKKEARKVLATFLPEEEVVGMLGIFKEMDTDGDGVLTMAELRSAMNCKGIFLPEGQFKDLLNRVDLNNDGVLDYEEFLAATVHQLRLDKDEIMFKAFKKFDTDQSGFITEAELRAALAHQGAQMNIDEILRDVDTDHDGRINYEEFCDYVRGKQESDNGLESLAVSGAQPRRLLNSVSSRHSRGPRPLLNSGSNRPTDRLLSRSMNKSKGILKKARSVRFRESLEVTSLGASGLQGGYSSSFSESQSGRPSQQGCSNWEHDSRGSGSLGSSGNNRSTRRLAAFDATTVVQPTSSSRIMKVSSSGRFQSGGRSSRLPSRQLVRDASIREPGPKSKVQAIAARSGQVIARPTVLPPILGARLPFVCLPNSPSIHSHSPTPCERVPSQIHAEGSQGHRLTMQSREASYSRNHIKYRAAVQTMELDESETAWSKDRGAEVLLSVSREASRLSQKVIDTAAITRASE